MVGLVGLLDYDAVLQKKYITPNYDLGVTYGVLKQNPNLNVRLIISLDEANLQKYDEILVFKIFTYPYKNSGQVLNINH